MYFFYCLRPKHLIARFLGPLRSESKLSEGAFKHPVQFTVEEFAVYRLGQSRSLEAVLLHEVVTTLLPDPRKDLESRSPNLGPYTTKGTL